MAVVFTNLWDFAHIASTLNLSFSICNLRVLIALISPGRCEGSIGRPLAVPGMR